MSDTFLFSFLTLPFPKLVLTTLAHLDLFYREKQSLLIVRVCLMLFLDKKKKKNFPLSPFNTVSHFNV